MSNKIMWLILRLFKKYEGILQYEKKIGFSAQNEK